MSKMDLSGKLSLYDFLTMLVCGFMILALFVPLPSEEHQWIILIIFSYLTGLIYHRILEYIRAKICECKIFSSCQFLGTIFTSNNHCAIQKAKDIVWEQNDLKSQKCNKEDLKAIQDEYYTAYYSIMDKPTYNNIIILETQEAFLRNFTWILLLFYLPFQCCHNSIIDFLLPNFCETCCMVKSYFILFILISFFAILFSKTLFILVLFIGLIFVGFIYGRTIFGIIAISIGIFVLILSIRYWTQMKIYKLVWYGYKYTHNKE